ncbi:MAG: hypothetical protein GKS04_03060 [Candidatus Mycalebacterium zealandia]|nr:MAG: hypothetical protein GKS04_03060 [Candidatus Mycalebacterium zealandia]
METAAIFFGYFVNTFLILAPVLLVGLFLSGLMHILISREQVLELIGRNDLRSSIMAAFAGIPVPLCSSSVLPVVSELRKKGASKPACASFLVTAPEIGVDSIPITYALLGPLVAIFRPVASFFSGIATSIMILVLDGKNPDAPPDADTGGEKCCHQGMSEEDYIGFSGIRDSVSASFGGFIHRAGFANQGSRSGPRVEHMVEESRRKQSPAPLGKILRKVSRHAFVEQMDEILYPLFIGILAGGVLVVALPSDLSAYGISGPVPYFLLLFAGVPVYICASATPIAAALVFLLSGPATNTGTIAVLSRQFGWRFTSIYVSSIAVASLVSGVLFDLILIKAGWSVSAWMGGALGGVTGFIQIAAFIAVMAIAVWRTGKNPKFIALVQRARGIF